MTMTTVESSPDRASLDHASLDHTSLDHTDACDRNDVYAAACPCRDMLDLLANKWSALAIGALENGPLRFGELKRTLEGISPKVLSATMKRLEDAELVDREVFAEVPARVEYSLTPLGHSASAPLAHLRDWVNTNVTRH